MSYSEPLSPRQEAFCRYVARGASAAAAARAAGYSPETAKQQGSRLMSRIEIRRRVWLLRHDREQRLWVDQQRIVDALQQILHAARQEGDFRTALRCVELEARLIGVLPDRPLAMERAAPPVDEYATEPAPDGMDDEDDIGAFLSGFQAVVPAGAADAPPGSGQHPFGEGQQDPLTNANQC